VKTFSESNIDVKVRKHREQTGLETRVVYAVNAEFSILGLINIACLLYKKGYNK